MTVGLVPADSASRNGTSLRTDCRTCRKITGIAELPQDLQDSYKSQNISLEAARKRNYPIVGVRGGPAELDLLT